MYESYRFWLMEFAFLVCIVPFLIMGILLTIFVVKWMVTDLFGKKEN